MYTGYKYTCFVLVCVRVYWRCCLHKLHTLLIDIQVCAIYRTAVMFIFISARTWLTAIYICLSWTNCHKAIVPGHRDTSFSYSIYSRKIQTFQLQYTPRYSTCSCRLASINHCGRVQFFFRINAFASLISASTQFLRNFSIEPSFSINLKETVSVHIASL